MLQRTARRSFETHPGRMLACAAAALLLALIMAAMPKTAFAAQETQDGVALTIDTEKTAYVAGDTIKGRAVVENTNDFPVQDVRLTVDLPSDPSFTVVPSEASAALLAPGETLAIDFEAALPVGNGGGDKGTGGSATPTKAAALANTGDGFPGALIAAGVLVAAAAVAVAAHRRKVKPSDVMALVLVAALAAPVAAAGMPAAGKAYADPSSLHATHSIKAIDDQKDLKAAAVYTIPAPTPTTQTVTFLKTDSASGNPLADAEFTLSGANGGYTTTSSAEGVVTFPDVPFGSYTLVETQAPAGYLDDPTNHAVEVDATGVTIDGASMSQFSVANTPRPVAKTPPPTINSIIQGNPFITGNGVPNATLTLVWPRGLGSAETVVDASGSWMVVAPASVQLLRNDIVSANQTLAPMLPSDFVEQIVIGAV
ncbi:prealbumin-like fold domain-containing protein [Gordonibacter massiliensis (ex Traore et al. 2017)]|uniref:Prealbumin-like fold domain-containing protein n=1 Tax=Gordonibacter massiliensis (ex Traore et al. 2017) TaxID=1841863 RepID=A0A842JHW9_9ACTN|nr:prealbumin-like fold domain-containing protein [Gordonibacter massiliensis (ex Traore et al. 2017)]MBC2889438.1 prealbumin-like fold domain-containing protein [Gordonibacter massiliensis (ex Traore et al. 2017)]